MAGASLVTWVGEGLARDCGGSSWVEVELLPGKGTRHVLKVFRYKLKQTSVALCLS